MDVGGGRGVRRRGGHGEGRDRVTGGGEGCCREEGFDREGRGKGRGETSMK